MYRYMNFNITSKIVGRVTCAPTMRWHYRD